MDGYSVFFLFEEKGVTREFIVNHLFKPLHGKLHTRKGSFPQSTGQLYEKSEIIAWSIVVRIHRKVSKSCKLKRLQYK
jgi:hypothetical protein